jgi:hypothetical protein
MTNSQPTLRNAHRLDCTTPVAGSIGLASAPIVANMSQTTKPTCGAPNPQTGSAARTSPRFRMNNSEYKHSGRRADQQGERLHTVCRCTNSLRNTYTAPVRRDILNLYTFMTAGMQAGHRPLMTPRSWASIEHPDAPSLADAMREQPRAGRVASIDDVPASRITQVRGDIFARPSTTDKEQEASYAPRRTCAEQ